MAVSDQDFIRTFSRSHQLDRATLEQVYDRFAPRIFKYTHFRLNDDQAVQVTGEIFDRLAEILKKRPKSINDLQAWLFEAARQRVENQISHNQRTLAYAKTKAPAASPYEHPHDTDDTAWLGDLVRKSLLALPLENQHLLALRFSSGCSIEEIARLMEHSINDLKSLQFEALSELRKQLEQAV